MTLIPLVLGSLSWGTGESRLGYRGEQAGDRPARERSWHRKVNDRTKIDSPEEDSDRDRISAGKDYYNILQSQPSDRSQG